MSEGREQRARMDTEGFKGLLLMHGGGAVAMLAFLPQVLDEPQYRPMAFAAIGALMIYQLGLVAAVIHNRNFRKCSLEYDRGGWGSPDTPPPCDKPWLAWLSDAEEPCSCCKGIAWMWASIGLFVLAAVALFVGGIRVL